LAPSILPRKSAQDIAATRQQLDPPTWRKEGATTTVYWRGAERGDQFYRAISNMSILVKAVVVTTNENLPDK
jgi:hypothetical protein